MATKKTAEKPGFIANIDTANEEIQRLTGELATAVEANGVAVQAQKDAQAKFDKDLQAAKDAHAQALTDAQAKFDKDLKEAKDSHEAALNDAKTKAAEEGKKEGAKDIVKACAAAGVAVPANIAGDAAVDDSKVKTPDTKGLTGLARAIAANVADAEGKK